MIIRQILVLLVSYLAACIASSNAQEASSKTQDASTHRVICEGVEFTLPQGLKVTKTAGEPLIKWPIVADWDSRGRLVVAESGGVGFPIQEHNKQKLHRIVRLVDRDGDGTFDDRIVAADKLAFPEGVLCLGNDILVAAPPVIWKLTDTDGDGQCEERSIWFDGTTVTNCANDLHGPYLGRDGWIYWCKGAFGNQTHQLLDGREFQSTAAHIYRRRLSGGPIEPLISGGMDNPVEVAFLATGDKFFTSTFLHHPHDDLRDGIGHAVYGSVFGKDHRVINGLTRTGKLMTPMVELGPAAPSGLLAASAHCKSAFGVERETPVLVSALFNLHKLMMHRLVEKGSSYATVDSDLISTNRADFHPTDVIEDGGGNLLLIDTGGWYDLCCPTSRVDQKTAPGGIYRIEPERGPESKVVSDLAQADSGSARPDSDSANPGEVPWDQLAARQVFELFGDSRPWVRRSAKRRFSRFGDEAVAICRSILEDPRQSLDMRRSAVWTLCRLESPASANALVLLLEKQPPAMLLPILHSIALRQITEGRRAAEALLKHPSPAVRRVSAQTLGRIGDASVVRSLLDSCRDATGDRPLQHAITYALIEIGRRHREIDYVAQANGDAAVHAALVSTRELGRVESIHPGILLDGLDSVNVALRSTALELLSDRPEAVPSSIERLRSAWSDLDTVNRDPPAYFAVLVERWRDQLEINRLIDDWYSGASELSHVKQSFLADQMNRFYPIGAKEERIRVIERWLADADVDVRQRLLKSLRSVEYTTSGEVIASLLIQNAATVSGSERLAWLSALPSGTELSDPDLGRTVIEALVSDDTAIALLSANVLDRVRLENEIAGRLLSSLDQVRARHLPTVIESLIRSGEVDLQIAMLNKLNGLPAARTLREDYLPTLVRKSEPEVRELANKIAKTLVKPSVDIQNAVDKLLSELPAGDPVRGLQVFRGNKAACSSCHRMGYVGKNIGPVLTRIGGSRTPEALLEAIVFPNSRLEQSYRSTQVLTNDGQAYNGLVEHRSEEVMKIRIGADRVVSIPLDQIEIERASDVSVMPSGIGELLSKQELADLLALLRAAK